MTLKFDRRKPLAEQVLALVAADPSLNLVETLTAVIELQRAHDESAIRSERARAVHARRKAQAEAPQ